MKNKQLYIKSGAIIAAIVMMAVLLVNFNSSMAVETSTLLSEQVVDNLKFMNASFENNKLTVVVYNTLEDSYNLKTIDVTFEDASHNEITTVTGYIGERLEPNDMKQLVISTDVDLENAVHVKYSINK